MAVYKNFKKEFFHKNFKIFFLTMLQNGRGFLKNILPMFRRFPLQISTTSAAFNGDYEYENAKSEDEVVQITYIQRDGTERKVRGKIGDNAMYLAHRY